MKTSKILTFTISLLFLTATAAIACPVGDKASADIENSANLAAAEFFYGINASQDAANVELNIETETRQQVNRNALVTVAPADFYGYEANNFNRQAIERTNINNMAEVERRDIGDENLSAAAFFYSYQIDGREAGQCINC